MMLFHNLALALNEKIYPKSKSEFPNWKESVQNIPIMIKWFR